MFSTSSIPLAEMISSDHSTAEISHFLNKWCLSVKTLQHKLIKCLNLRRDHARMKRSAKRSGLEVRRVDLVILNQLLIKLVRYLQISSLVKVLM